MLRTYVSFVFCSTIPQGNALPDPLSSPPHVLGLHSDQQDGGAREWKAKPGSGHTSPFASHLGTVFMSCLAAREAGKCSLILDGLELSSNSESLLPKKEGINGCKGTITSVCHGDRPWG